MFSCKFCEIFQNTFFYRTLPVAASEMNWVIMDFTNELGTWGYFEKNYTYFTFIEEILNGKLHFLCSYLLTFPKFIAKNSKKRTVVESFL